MESLARNGSAATCELPIGAFLSAKLDLVSDRRFLGTDLVGNAALDLGWLRHGSALAIVKTRHLRSSDCRACLRYVWVPNCQSRLPQHQCCRGVVALDSVRCGKGRARSRVAIDCHLRPSDGSSMALRPRTDRLVHGVADGGLGAVPRPLTLELFKTRRHRAGRGERAGFCHRSRAIDPDA